MKARSDNVKVVCSDKKGRVKGNELVEEQSIVCIDIVQEPPNKDAADKQLSE